MIYLDYSATTPVDEIVLETFNKVTKDYIGNPNSLHKLGMEANELMTAASNKISSLLKTDSEVIFTSGATEANNLAIFGVINKYKNRGKKIITTHLEHSSINYALKSLEDNGYVIEYVSLNSDGTVNIDNLKKIIDDNTILVTIAQVNSEIGLIQDVNEIGKIINKYPKCIFHVDGTQAVGKTQVNLENIDLFTFTAHKIYGIKGVGALIKKKNIEIEPIIYGGKSQTIYRAGTPTLALDVSMAKALNLAMTNFQERYNKVKKINEILISKLKEIKNIHINSNDKCVPHIINISIPFAKSETVLHALEQENIYISTKTACSKQSNLSESVYSLTKNETYAKTSIRISISHLTTEDEINTFVDIFKYKLNQLESLGNKNE